MSDANPFSDPDQNAYRPPQYVSPATPNPSFDSARLQEFSARVRSFRGNCWALAAVLCITIIVQAARLRAEGVSPQAKLKNGVIAE